MAHGFDAVSLDVGGVLVVPDHGALAAALDRVGARHDRSAFGPGHYHAMAAVDLATSDPEDFTDYALGFVRAVDVPEAQQPAAREALLAILTTPVWSQPVAGSRQGIRALAEAGVRLAVTSNSDGTVADHLARSEWLQVGEGPGVAVEVVTDSGAVGVGKPDPRLFQATLDVLDLPPDRVLHVGDSVHYDVDGAAAFGFQAVHMDPFGVCASRGHRHVRTLAEVLATR